jgi:hypothetical protein
MRKSINSLIWNKRQVMRPSRRSQRARKLAIPDDYEVYECDEFQTEGDPTSFEEALTRQSGLKPCKMK